MKYGDPTLLGSEIVTKYGDFLNSIFFLKRAFSLILKRGINGRIFPISFMFLAVAKFAKRKRKNADVAPISADAKELYLDLAPGMPSVFSSVFLVIFLFGPVFSPVFCACMRSLLCLSGS